MPASLKSSAVAALGCSCFLVLIAFASVANAATRENPGFRGSHGTLFESLFWDAGLDDRHFHDCVKAELSNGMRLSPISASRAFIMGVEWGHEVIEFARQGYEVVGTEPFPKYVMNLTTAAAIEGVLDKVNVYLAAAGAERGHTDISYNNATVSTPVVRLDDIVKEDKPVDILSIDVHGGATNYDVLLGGLNALKKGLFKSIWVELFPQDDWGIKMLEMLRSMDYVMFDFRWHGGSISCSHRKIPAHECDDLKGYRGPRPQGTAEQYMEMMTRVRDKEFQWMQTDVIAIPRKEMPRMKNVLHNAASTCKAKAAL